MFHDGWFWLSAVESLILLAIVALVVWALRAPRGPRVAREPCKPEHFSVEAKISPQNGEVHIDYDRRVTSVSLNPSNARFLATKIQAAADVAELAEAEERELLPTAWDRIKGDGRL